MRKKRKAAAPKADGLREALCRRLPDLRQVLRGTLIERYRRCGDQTCHCARPGDPGHGPAHLLMVTLGPGKTTVVYVPVKHREKVKEWVENFREAREILEKISTMNRELLRKGRLFKEL